MTASNAATYTVGLQQLQHRVLTRPVGSLSLPGYLQITNTNHILTTESMMLLVVYRFADRTNGRAIGTVLRSSSVCRL